MSEVYKVIQELDPFEQNLFKEIFGATSKTIKEISEKLAKPKKLLKKLSA